MVVSKTFDGFADPAKDAAILITVLPAEAFAQIEKVLDTDALKKQGVTVDKREPMQLGFGKGILLIGRQVAEKEHFKKWLSGRGRRRPHRDGHGSGPRSGRRLFGPRAADRAGDTGRARQEYPKRRN